MWVMRYDGNQGWMVGFYTDDWDQDTKAPVSIFNRVFGGREMSSLLRNLSAANAIASNWQQLDSAGDAGKAAMVVNYLNGGGRGS